KRFNRDATDTAVVVWPLLDRWAMPNLVLLRPGDRLTAPGESGRKTARRLLVTGCVVALAWGVSVQEASAGSSAATMSSVANQIFTVGQAATTASVVTVTDANPHVVAAATDLRI